MAFGHFPPPPDCVAPNVPPPPELAELEEHLVKTNDWLLWLENPGPLPVEDDEKLEPEDFELADPDDEPLDEPELLISVSLWVQTPSAR